MTQHHRTQSILGLPTARAKSRIGNTNGCDVSGFDDCFPCCFYSCSEYYLGCVCLEVYEK